ncbi:hypothetical protein [Nocardioides daphniae]|uniref:Uncharacterized protein n=1 Tax=Nocardioides daphniae TaxID=402297 RepID=A0ABQ1Q8Y4_9ACTN|nr:hypothetical protein [Nocardioides daphniae]GGD16667.1 hypothetical protein GCM10007231_14520 [Nocardioides daphniae]
MTDIAVGGPGLPTGAPVPAQNTPAPGQEWLTSLWQQVYTIDASSMLQGAATVGPLEQPGLWHFVRTVAMEAGSPPPEQIRVVGNSHVVTHEDPFSLDIGVPLLLALDQGDLAEIITRALTDRMADRGETVAVPAQQRPSRLGRLGRLLGGGSSSSSGSSSASGKGQSRLEDAIATATQWWIDEFVLPDLTDNLVPRPVYLGLIELLMERGGEIADHAQLEERPHDPAHPQAGEPAMFLLTNEDALLEAVADAGLPPGTQELFWEDAMTRWAHRRARSSSLILFKAATPEVRTLAGLLDVIERGDLGKRVGNALRSKEAAVREDCVFLLTGVLADAFAEHGAGDLTCSWGGVIDLVSPSEGHLDLCGVARQVVDDTSVVPFLRDILADYKVNSGWSPSEVGTADDRAYQSFLTATGRRKAPGTGFLQEVSAS